MWPKGKGEEEGKGNGHRPRTREQTNESNGRRARITNCHWKRNTRVKQSKVVGGNS
jgi:hypothetical protein